MPTTEDDVLQKILRAISRLQRRLTLTFRRPPVGVTDWAVEVWYHLSIA
jgi:hypothetical protein